jgi:DNA-binding phage protein
MIMPLTRSFRETVQARARRDVKFRQALLAEAMQALLDGNLEEGRAALRSCINATIGFEKLGIALGRSPKSLMRMFGPSGNPTAENLLGVISLLQEETGVRLHVRAVAGEAGFCRLEHGDRRALGRVGLVGGEGWVRGEGEQAGDDWGQQLP